MVKINLEEITSATYAWLKKNERRIVISSACLLAVAALGLISCGTKKITLAEAQAIVDAQRTTDASGCAAAQGVIAQDLGNQLTASHAEATNGVEDLQTQVVSLQGTLGAPTLTPLPSETASSTPPPTNTPYGLRCYIQLPWTRTPITTITLEPSRTPSSTPRPPDSTSPPGGGGGGDTPEPTGKPGRTREPNPTDIPTQQALTGAKG